jgi:hypothetical protein
MRHLINLGVRLLWGAIVAPLATTSPVAWGLSIPTESVSAQLHACSTFSDYFIVEHSHPIASSNLHYSIMPSRYQDLNEAMTGNRLSGQSMVAFDGSKLVPAGYTDDPGIYLLIPWVSRHLHMTLAASVTTFFLSSLGLAILSGCLGFWFSLKSKLGRLLGVTGVLLLGLIAYRTGDVYLFEFAVPVALLPWALHFVSNDLNSKGFSVYMCVTGLLIGTAGVIRTSAALPTLFFLMVLSLFGSTRLKRRAAVLSFLLCGFLLPNLYFYELALNRDAYLANAYVDRHVETTRHVFWHFAYIGLGFLSNPYVPGGICDEVGKARVHEIDPNAIYLSAAYDRVLQRETLATVWHHPIIAVFTLFAKVGIVACLFAAFANIGLLAAFFHRKSAQVELAFWAALTICAGPLLVMAPLPLYSVGLISWATIYGIVSLDYAMDSRQRPALPEIDTGRELLPPSPATIVEGRTHPEAHSLISCLDQRTDLGLS